MRIYAAAVSCVLLFLWMKLHVLFSIQNRLLRIADQLSTNLKPRQQKKTVPRKTDGQREKSQQKRQQNTNSLPLFSLFDPSALQTAPNNSVLLLRQLLCTSRKHAAVQMPSSARAHRPSVVAAAASQHSRGRLCGALDGLSPDISAPRQNGDLANARANNEHCCFPHCLQVF